MTTPSPESDDDLLMRMRNGEEEAFVSLYRRRQGAIYRFAMHMSGSAHTAEDVTQEVFLALIRDDCGFDPERGSLSAYLFGIARKLVLRQLERGRADLPLDVSGEESTRPPLAATDNPFIDLTRKETLELLRKAVLALPRRYREVVVLCDLEELDYADAAVALGCPIGTVRSRLHRARALLFEKLSFEKGARSQATAALGWNPLRSFI
jgi:RNA polymerase sigma-70 factor, ECF subfamily